MNKGFEPEDFNPRFMDDRRDDFINHVYIPMGITAENVAERFGVGRSRMDEYAKLSQDRAVAAQADGFLRSRDHPGAARRRHDRDPGMTVPGRGQRSKSWPAFRRLSNPEGVVTAGNACPLNDGAAAVIIMSDERAAALGITPLARIVASSVSALAPEIMGVGPVEAVGKVLARAGMTIGDVDIVELNEAFAAQVFRWSTSWGSTWTASSIHTAERLPLATRLG